MWLCKVQDGFGVATPFSGFQIWTNSVIPLLCIWSLCTALKGSDTVQKWAMSWCGQLANLESDLKCGLLSTFCILYLYRGSLELVTTAGVFHNWNLQKLLIFIWRLWRNTWLGSTVRNVFLNERLPNSNEAVAKYVRNQYTSDCDDQCLSNILIKVTVSVLLWGHKQVLPQLCNTEDGSVCLAERFQCGLFLDNSGHETCGDEAQM